MRLDDASSDEEADEDDLHAKMPPLPGHKDHRCTDWGPLAVFLLAVALQAYMFRYGKRHGDLRSLTRGYDHQRQLCTEDGGGGNMMYCTTRSGSVLDHWPICVEQCPHGGTNHAHTCFRNDTGQLAELLDYESVEVFGYCLPTKPELLSKTLEVMSASTSGVHAGSMTAWLGHLRRICRAWLPLLICANAAIVIGYIYLLLLDRCAKLLVFVCEAVFFFGTLLVGVYQIWSAVQGHGCGQHCDSDEYTAAIREGTDPALDICLGVALIVVALLALCVFNFANSRIETAVGCIEATCECIFEEPSLLLEPFISLFFKVCVMLTCGSNFVCLIASGKLTLFDNGFERSFSYDPVTGVYLVCQVFLALWGIEVCHTCSQYSLAWTTQMWYFTPYVNGHKIDQERCSVCRAYGNAIRYHLGTLVLGAALNLLTRPLRYTVGFVHVLVQNSRFRKVGIFAALHTWYRANIAKVQKTAFMDVAITSANYMVAADRSLAILEEEVKSLSVLNGAQAVFQVALIALLSLVGFFGMVILSHCVPLFTDVESGHYIQDPGVVAIASAVMCGVIGVSFTLVFDTVGDTILYCFATEQRRHAQLDHKTYNSLSHEPPGFFGWLTGYGDVEQDVHEDQLKVDYAPQRLRDLIHASNNEVDNDEADAGGGV